MSLFWPSTIAFIIGVLFTWFELLTSKYPTTGHLIALTRPVIIYCGIYGAIAALGFRLSGLLIESGKLKIEGLGLESPQAQYILAVVLGLSAKAIMQINLYTVTAGSTPFPLGLQTLVQLFEPHLLRSILVKEDDEVRKFVAPFAAKYPITETDKNNLAVVKQKIIDNIPAQLSKPEQSAFENDIGKDTQVRAAMEHFLRFLGRGTFLRVFK